MVSIIIPCYNVEKYIPICLNYLSQQTYKEYEIICVDDCSDDNTLNILQSLEKNALNLKILHNEIRQYPNQCRNIGLNNAKGEYIIFVDADDLLIDFTFLQNAINIFQKQRNVDMIIGDTLVWDNENNQNYDIPFSVNKMLSIDKKEDALNLGIGWSVWAKIYRKSLLIKINEILKDVIFIFQGEDIFIYFLCVCYAKEIYFYKKNIYLYNSHPNSYSYSKNIYKQNPPDEKWENQIIAIWKLILNKTTEDKIMNQHIRNKLHSFFKQKYTFTKLADDDFFNN